MWLINRGVRSEDTLGSLFTRWPKAYPKEFLGWGGMSVVMLGLLCLFLFIPYDLSLLSQQHLNSPGTFVEYHGEHGNITYTFIVQGRRYQGYSSSDKDNLAQIRAGQPFDVYYNPANPNINNLSEPVRSWMLSRMTATFFVTLLMGILAIIVRKLGVLIRRSSSALSNSIPS